MGNRSKVIITASQQLNTHSQNSKPNSATMCFNPQPEEMTLLNIKNEYPIAEAGLISLYTITKPDGSITHTLMSNHDYWTAEVNILENVAHAIDAPKWGDDWGMRGFHLKMIVEDQAAAALAEGDMKKYHKYLIEAAMVEEFVQEKLEAVAKRVIRRWKKFAKKA